MSHCLDPVSKSNCVQSVSGTKTGAGGSAGGSGLSPEMLSPEKPPLTNRGAQISFPLQNQFLIDWVSFTFKLNDPRAVIEIIGLKQSLFTELDAGMHGYRKSLRYGKIGVFYDGQACMGCHVSISGQGCRQYEGQFEENPWLDLFTNALSHKAKFTRLDIANDNVDGALDLTKLQSAIESKQIRSLFKNASEISTFSFSSIKSKKDDARTIYFGKRSSRVFIRFYDKAAQLETPLPWIRAEIELKKERAQKAVELMASGVPIGEIFVGVLNTYIAVINLDNNNISRCTLQTWWQSWLQSTEKIKLSTSRAIKTVEEAMDFVNRQYSPTLAMIKEYLGVAIFSEYIQDLVANGKERMSMKHEKMMFLSQQCKTDNYDQKREDFEERAAIIEYDGGKQKATAEALAHILLDRVEEGHE